MIFDCLAQCGLRDGIAKFGQFCIDHQLAAALRGDVKHGLFFLGAGRLPFGDQIRSERELIAYLLDRPIAEIAARSQQMSEKVCALLAQPASA
jgi:nitronate monooxygenase